MIFDKDMDEYALSTGKRMYAHCGVIGLSRSHRDNNFEVSEGYDGGISWPLPGWWSDEDKNEFGKHYLTNDEMREVAEYMIAEWTALRDSLK